VESDEKLLAISAEIDEFECYDIPAGRRVASIAGALGRSFNLASQDLFFLNQAALLHDIGEMAMGRHYITLARELTANERIDLERHPVIGEQETAKQGLPRAVQLIVRWHHEWWNGSGYPDRIEGEQIPLAARILRAADTYTAITATRPFRRSNSDEEARQHITEWAGIEIDPEVARALLNIRIPEVETLTPQGASVERHSLSILN